MVYLDYNATTPLDEKILAKMRLYLTDIYSNPSSVYRFAQVARKAVEDARQDVAQLLCASVDEIIFTAGGTESDNTAIKGIAWHYQNKGKHIVTSKIEHHAVLNPCKFLEKHGFELTYINVDEYGIIDLEQLKKSLRKDTILVSIMYANNEVGTIQPIKEVGRICRENGTYFHTDAVQAVGKIPIDVNDLGIDLLSLSAHKLYGPKGVGALYVKKGIKFEPLLHGGQHEKNRRAGTENVSGIVGLGEAARVAKVEMANEEEKIRLLRDKLEQGIKDRIPEVKINGHPKDRLYNTLNVCIRYIEGESILINLDFEDICASSGSACTSGSLEPSHVLLAMGIPHEVAHGSLRFSLGKYNTDEDIEKVLKVLPGIVEKLRKMSPFWNKK
ncbi:MAG: cysteine desulfurase NifS [Candidatus Omnitrophota bacterium]|nr:cysteine desulfurase NifS [Candidatus Omnitrophota bacterium]